MDLPQALPSERLGRVPGPKVDIRKAHDAGSIPQFVHDIETHNKWRIQVGGEKSPKQLCGGNIYVAAGSNASPELNRKNREVKE
jgi:hypothetical protein